MYQNQDRKLKWLKNKNKSQKGKNHNKMSNKVSNKINKTTNTMLRIITNSNILIASTRTMKSSSKNNHIQDQLEEVEKPAHYKT